ncbi:MAG: DUF2226 domain-containing protein, partial [Archaeoglobaceae archaeon]
MSQIKGPIKIERGKSYEMIEKLKEQKFTGLIRISFKTDEISKSELLVEGGIPIAMETRKIRTGRILRGNEAFQDFLSAENCVSEFYPADLKNPSFLSFIAVSRLDLDRLLGLTKEAKVEEVKKAEEVKAVIVEKKESEFDKKKHEIAKILDLEIGKIAKKYVKLVESAGNSKDLFEARNQIFEFLDSTTTFLPKERVLKIKSEIDRIFE